MMQKQTFINSKRVSKLAVLSLCFTCLSGCRQYNFADGVRSFETETYTEYYTVKGDDLETNAGNTKEYQNTTPKSIEISHAVSGDATSTEQMDNQNTKAENPEGTNRHNALSYPANGYEIITDSYINAVINTVNETRVSSGLPALSQSPSYAEDANIYAANMAAQNKFISENTNNDAALATCMTSRAAEKAICSSVSSMLASRPNVLNASSISIGIASGKNGYVYLCIFYD